MLQRELRRWLTTYTEELQAQGLALTDDMLLLPSRTHGQFSYAAGDPTARYKHMVQTFHRGSLRPYDELRKPFRIAQRAFTAFGIEHQRGMGIHTFRRSCARAVFESLTEHGYDRALRSTMSLLGHKNSATTELYLGLSLGRTDGSNRRRHRPRDR